MQHVALVVGSFEREAVAKGFPLSEQTVEFLQLACLSADVSGSLIFVTSNPYEASKPKAKIGMARIKQERPRVLQEISEAKPDFVLCLGPVASACVFGKGNLVESELLRREHRPLGENQPPVFVTFGLEYARYAPGVKEWIQADLLSARGGGHTTEWGEYTVLLPDDPAWHVRPPELADCPYVGYDLETYPGTNPWADNARIRMAVVSDQVGRAWVVQATQDSKFPQWIYDIIEDPRILKAGSNIKFDYLWHARFGHRIVNMWDTTTVEHILNGDNPKKDLKSLAFKYVPKLGDYSYKQRMLVKERGGWEFIDDAEMYQYAGGDGEASVGTYEAQARELPADLLKPVHLFADLQAVLADMQHNGACIDLDENWRLSALYNKRLLELRTEIVNVLGPINVNSPPELAAALTRAVPNISLSVWKKALGDDEELEISTKRAILERESDKHSIIKTVLEYRNYRTRNSTFIHGLRTKHLTKRGSKHFIFPNFNTAVVPTYRLSSSNPNGQNMPRKDEQHPELSVKRQFISRFAGGSILDADQSQIEIRMAAFLSQDKKMLEAIRLGEDIHTSMAAVMLNKPTSAVTEQERQECKTRTFLILYGGGARKLAGDLKISVRKAQQLINEYFEAFSGLKNYIDQTHREVKRDLEVRTIFGLRRTFQRPSNWASSDGWMIQRQAFNTKVQSSAACITYVAMLDLAAELKRNNLKSLMVLQVHDSVVVDVYPGEERIVAKLAKKCMENAGIRAAAYGAHGIDVPLKCDVKIGPTWADVQLVEDA
jgi:DNA polymerase-1